MFKSALFISSLSLFSLLLANDQKIVSDGDIRVNNHPLTDKTRIQAGDIISTTKGSHLRFNIGKDAFMSKGKSKFTLKKSSSERVLKIIDGGVVAVFGGGGKHSIETKNMTAGIRGTGTYTEVKDGKTYFCTCYGETTIHSKTVKFSENIATHNHVMMWATDKGVKYTMDWQGHSDEDLIQLEAHVGREADFIKK